jgi:hypothetical protein
VTLRRAAITGALALLVGVAVGLATAGLPDKHHAAASVLVSNPLGYESTLRVLRDAEGAAGRFPGGELGLNPTGAALQRIARGAAGAGGLSDAQLAERARFFDTDDAEFFDEFTPVPRRIVVSVWAGSAVRATAAARALARSLIAWRSEVVTGRLLSLREALATRQRVVPVPAARRVGAQIAQLEVVLELERGRLDPKPQIEVVATPASPNPVRDGLVAAACVLALGLLAAALRRLAPPRSGLAFR